MLRPLALVLLVVLFSACGDESGRKTRAELEAEIAELELKAAEAFEAEDYKAAARLLAQIAQTYMALDNFKVADMYGTRAESAEDDADDDDKTDYHRYRLLNAEIALQLPNRFCPTPVFRDVQRKLGPDFTRSAENIEWLLRLGDCYMPSATDRDEVRKYRRYYVEADHALRHLTPSNPELAAQVKERLETTQMLLDPKAFPYFPDGFYEALARSFGPPPWEEAPTPPQASKLSAFRRFFRWMDAFGLKLFGQEPSQTDTAGS